MSHLDYNLNRENRGEKYVKIVQDLKKNINDVRQFVNRFRYVQCNFKTKLLAPFTDSKTSVFTL